MTKSKLFLLSMAMTVAAFTIGWLACEHIKYRHGIVYDGRIEIDQILPESGVELIADDETVMRFDSIDALAHACAEALRKAQP